MAQLNNNDNSYITLKDLLEIFLSNIWLFVASIAVCVAVAAAYVAVTPPSYQRTASILIKDDSPGQSLAGSSFESMGLVQSNTDINNEIHILATSQLMEEVVARLSLHYNYSLKYKGVRWIDMYKSAPFRVELDSMLVNSSVRFEFTTDGANSFNVDNIVINGMELSGDIDGAYEVPVVTDFGSFTVRKSAIVPNNIEDNLYYFAKGSVEGTAGAYVGALAVTLRSQNASIIDLRITSGSTQKAEDILNTLIAVYNENWIKDKNMVSLSTTNFINERLAIIAQELGAVDQDISSYKSENLLPDVGVVAGMNLQSSNETLQRQIELNNQLSMARYILQYIEGSGNASNQLLPVNSGIESSAIDGQITRYNDLLLQKNTLLANSSANNPVVAELINDIEALKNVLVLSVNDLINTLVIQVENARREEIAAQTRLSNNPSQELYLLSTGREQMIKEELYLFLLQKREENELNQAFTAYNTKILSMAKGSNAPVAPQKKVILLFGFAIGCIIPVVFLILKAGLQTTIQSKDDLSGLAVPFLGSIPLIYGKKRFFWQKAAHEALSAVITSSDGRDVVNESFRVVRTNLDFVLNQDKKCKTALLTSFNPKSGKSFVAVNLAMSMATKNSKVLVVDSDFRRGTLSHITNSPKSRGLVNYLNDSKLTVDDIVYKQAFHPMLDVLPMGATPPNPTELLLTDRFESLVEQLQQSYDYIFFDCPPLEIVPDASIIEKYCDSTIFVVRAGLMDKRLLPELETIYETKKLKNMGILLNGVDHRNKYGYGKYGYGKYGYGRYGYGYGSYGSESK